MTPATAIAASSTMRMMAVPGRTTHDRIPKHRYPDSGREGRSAYPSFSSGSASTPSKGIPKEQSESDGRLQLVQTLSRPPHYGGLDYMKEGFPSPWGGLGGYPFTPWTNVPMA